MTHKPEPPVRSLAEGASSAKEPAGPTVVGIGASAGGLRALKQLFATIPPDSGLAFVVVVHLSPEHESFLADLLQPHSPIPVVQVTGETPVEPNQAYVIPPGRNLVAVDSHLRLASLPEPRTERAPVDHFFRTLAKTHDGNSVAVILTGTGSDGAQGIRHIRHAGGMTLVQDPDEAEFDGMVRSALATGLVDAVLPVSAMMEQILEFAGTQPRVRVGDAEAPEEGDPLQTILTLVRLRTGHDFLRYKRSTVGRRVARRMQLLHLERIEEYVELLRENGREAATLLDDLLINVTSFFRDPEVFQRMEREVIPALFEGKGRDDTLRVWSVGCATGEEAYTLGMLLLEAAARHPAPPQLQVFATDLHEPSLRHARDGLYAEGIEAEVPPHRLERFFRRQGGGYCVVKELRDLVVFATHNLLQDPPFSRVDLIVCRNLLIYLQRDVQERVVDLFHYALRDHGFLLLGTAETLDRSELFRLENKETHLYRRRDVRRAAMRFPGEPYMAPAQPRRAPAADAPAPPAALPAHGFGAVHQRMVERYAPPSLLVAEDHEVVHLSEHAGRYLQHPGGEPTRNAFRLVREEFRVELRTALYAIRQRRVPWRSHPIPVRLDGEVCSVTLRVSPAEEPELEGFTLVIFDEETTDGGAAVEPAAGEDARELEAELEATRSRMQALIEEFETSQEEMRASNEELQSANEELRSTMEELETSREELQSVNEELQTLNQENRHKVEELSQLSSDLQNLLQATDIATVFLDRSLRILRYTPRASDIFNVRHTDRGRPLADLTHRLGYGGLIGDARQVLQTLVPVEHEVQGQSPDAWYMLRVTPYRTVSDHIEGVVITLVDVSALKRTEAALRLSEEKYHTLFDSMDEAYAVVDVLADEAGRWSDFLFVEVNPAFVKHTGMPYPVGRTATEILGTPNPHWAQLYGQVAATGESLRVEESELTLGRVFDLNIFRLGGAGSRRVAVLFTDVTVRVKAERALRESRARHAFLLALSDAVRPLADPLEIQAAAARLLGEQLDANRAFYAEVEGEEWRIAKPYERDVAPQAEGRHPLAQFGGWIADGFRAGERLVIRDLRADDRFDPSQRAAHEAYHILGAVAVPLVKEGALVSILVVHSATPRDWSEGEIALVEEAADRTWAAVQRARAEAALHESEARLRALTSASGDAIYRMSPDWSEMRQLDGRGILTDTAEPSGSWLELYIHPDDQARVTTTIDEAVRDKRVFELEHRVVHVDGTLGWTFSRAVPMLGDDGEIVEWVGAASDVTARKEAEAALRASEARQTYLVRLGDALRPLTDPLAVQETAARVLGEHLGADRVAYGEVADDDAHIDFAGNHVAPGVPPVTGRFRMAGFGNTLLAALRAGHTLVIPDVAASAELDPAERDASAALGIGALASTPLLRDGRFAANLVLHHRVPRPWTPDEIALVEETAERTWAAVELMRLRWRTEELNGFLIRFSDAVRGLADPHAVAETACRLVADKLGVERAYWAEVDWTTREFVVGAAFHLPGVRVIEGRFPVGAWEPFTSLHLAGRPVVVDDTAEDARISPEVRKGYAQIAVGADLAAPVIANGKLRCTLAVNQRLPRHWRPEEVELVHGIALRCWAEVERARAEAALRASEARYRTLFESMDEGFVLARMIYDAEGRPADALYLEGNPAASRLTGVADYSRRLLSEVPPGMEPEWLEIYDRVVRTGVAERLERYAAPLGRWYDFHVSHVAGEGGAGDEGCCVAVTFQEITERKWGEAALRASEERLRLFGEASSDILWIRDAETLRWVYLSPAFEGIYGFERSVAMEEYDLGDWARRIEPEDRERAVACIERVRAGEHVSFEFRIRRPDGEVRWLQNTDFPIQDAEGRVRWIGGIGQDVTRRRETEAALRESQAHLAAVFARAGVGLSELSLDGRFLRVNDELCHLLGRGREELVGTLVTDITHPDDAAPSLESMHRVVESNEIASLDKRYLRADGSAVWANSSFTRIDDAAGHPRSLLAVTVDLTLRRQAEDTLRELNQVLERRVDERTRELREQEERLRTLVETSALMVWTTDAEGQVVEDSPSWRAFTGQTVGEWLGEGWSRVLHPDDREFAFTRWFRSVGSETPVDAEFRVWHAASGSWRWTNLRAVPLRDPRGEVRGWIGMNIDVHERREAEAARTEAMRQLVGVEEEERRRISRELHDSLGQLVTGLALGLNTLERGSDGQRSRIEDMERLATRIADEMQHMAVELRPPALDNLGLQRALQGHLDEWSARHGVEASCHFTGLDGVRLPHELEIALFRVVQEGLTNALKHAHASHVSLVVERRGGVIRAILEDDGRGFDVEGTLASPEKARRLGLRGMRERMVLLGGELEIESSPGAGTSIFVRIPDPASESLSEEEGA